jgi:hypothetical protein
MRTIRTLSLALVLIPISAFAQVTTVLEVSTFGFGDRDVVDIVDNIFHALKITIIPVATTIFIAGAFFFVIYFGNEEQKSRGKNLMIGSLIGVAVVFGAQAILNFVMYFIYG